MSRKRKAVAQDDFNYRVPSNAEYLSSYVATETLYGGYTAVTTSKGKKKAKASEPAGEKRLARFKASCPKNIQERVARVRAQRFYMIDRSRNQGELKESFKVLGSTGNVYTVTIDLLPSCDCPDATKGNHCKHMIFVFLKILGVKEMDGLHYQKALLTTELEKIFAEAPEAPNATANNRLRTAYAKATGQPSTSTANQDDTSQMRKVDGEDCPICYEEMAGKTPAQLEKIVFCQTCQNGLHKECFSMWAMRNKTCVYCRSQWVAAGAGEDGDVDTEEGYMNLAAIAGVERLRDTSSYYQGPKRKQKYRPWMNRYR